VTRAATARHVGHGLGAATLPSLAFLALAMIVAMRFGTEPISLIRAVTDAASLDRVIVMEARLPRVLLAAIAGGGLAIVGVAFQAVLGNPLAEPYVLGVSGGSALGATLAIVLGFSGMTLLGAGAVPVAALAGGLAATAFVATVGRSVGTSPRTSMLLAGVVVNAMTSAAITLVKTLVAASQAQEVLFWLTGFLDASIGGAQLGCVAVYVLAGSVSLLRDAGRLNLLSLGDEGALHLGVDVQALERRTFIACSVIVGAIVSVTGLIGFVGLIVPHALRRLFGPDARTLLPASLFAGGGVLVLCDLGSRVLFRWFHRELPVGAVTALLGGPLFLVLLRRREGGVD
jgi:iron complex transport system permease protein